MGLVSVAKGQVIHRAAADSAVTLDIVVKGSVEVTTAGGSIRLSTGGVIGLLESPGAPYICTYTATEDTNIYSYPYSGASDVQRIVQANPKICPVLTAQCVRDAYEACRASQAALAALRERYDSLATDRSEYPILAVRAGLDADSFPELDTVEPPDIALSLEDWEIESLGRLTEHDERLRKHCYAIGPDVDLLFVMHAYHVMQAVADQSRRMAAWQDAFKKQTSRFTTPMPPPEARPPP